MRLDQSPPNVPRKTTPVKTITRKFRKGQCYAAIENLGFGPFAKVSRRKWTVLDRSEGFATPCSLTGTARCLPRVTVKCGTVTFYNVAVRSKRGIEYVDLNDIDTRVVALKTLKKSDI